MKSTKKILLYFVLVFHFGLVLVSNLAQALKSQNDLYYKEKSFYNKVDQFAKTIIIKISFFNTYQEITGTNTGYGFYAPQVSSHILPFFDLYSKEKKIADHFNIKLSNHEASLRFESVFSQHLKKLDEILKGGDLKELNKNNYYQFLDLRMHSLCTHIFNRVKTADRIKARLYLYKTPSMHDYTDYDTPFNPSYLKTFEYEYATK